MRGSQHNLPGRRSASPQQGSTSNGGPGFSGRAGQGSFHRTGWMQSGTGLVYSSNFVMSSSRGHFEQLSSADYRVMKPEESVRRPLVDLAKHLFHETVLDDESFFCPNCCLPMGCRIRLSPCFHAFCDECVGPESRICPKCSADVLSIEWVHPDDVLFRCSVEECAKVFLNRISLTYHQLHEHNIQSSESSTLNLDSHADEAAKNKIETPVLKCYDIYSSTVTGGQSFYQSQERADVGVRQVQRDYLTEKRSGDLPYSEEKPSSVERIGSFHTEYLAKQGPMQSFPPTTAPAAVPVQAFQPSLQSNVVPSKNTGNLDSNTRSLGIAQESPAVPKSGSLGRKPQATVNLTSAGNILGAEEDDDDLEDLI